VTLDPPAAIERGLVVADFDGDALPRGVGVFAQATF
jgi:hypothetical protein